MAHWRDANDLFLKDKGCEMIEINFEIKSSLGVLSTSNVGWTTELNLISWNNREPKYDIRAWSPDHSKMGKGVTLTESELKNLKEILEVIE